MHDEEEMFEKIAARLTESIARQIATTKEGRMFATQNPAALLKLVRNIVGNATYAVSEMIEEAKEG